MRVDNKIYSFMGLAMKAGKLFSGDETCEKNVKSGKVFLVLISADASENTRKKFFDICNFRGVDIRIFGEKELIGRYIGKEIRSVVAITDKGFAKRLIEMIDGKDLERGGV
jgi:ribosomal protein L7Ae-like RNA K-turn-binding protein